ncbi:MAG TPA: hypothetical protein V6C52_14190 [Coleofasciculaceae cyanobacterium]|jgi:hypothetical protein
MAVNNTTTGNGGGFMNPAKPTTKPDPQGKAQDPNAVDANRPVQENNKTSNPQQVGNSNNKGDKDNNRPADNANQLGQMQFPQQPKTDTVTFSGGPFSMQAPGNNGGFFNPANQLQFAQQPVAQQPKQEPVSVLSLLTPDQRQVLEPSFKDGNKAPAKPEAAVQAGTQAAAKPAAEQQQAKEAQKPKTFDAEFYLKQNPDVAAAVKRGETTPAEHFQKFGQAEGRVAFEGARPFDAAFYLKQNPDVAAAVQRGETTAIDHFRKFGKNEGRSPNAEDQAAKPEIIKNTGNNGLAISGQNRNVVLQGDTGKNNHVIDGTAASANNNIVIKNIGQDDSVRLTGEGWQKTETGSDGDGKFIVYKNAVNGSTAKIYTDQKEASFNLGERINVDAPQFKFGSLPPGLAGLFPPTPGNLLSTLIGAKPTEKAGGQGNSALMNLLDPLGLFSGLPATNPKPEPAKAAPEAQAFVQNPVLQQALKGLSQPDTGVGSMAAFLSGVNPAAGTPEQKAAAKAQVGQALQAGGLQNIATKSGNFAFGLSGQKFLPSANPNTILRNVARQQEKADAQAINEATQAQVQRALALSSIDPRAAQEAASTLALLG